jgi:acyl carrier protein phosphodiesterase
MEDLLKRVDERIAGAPVLNRLTRDHAESIQALEEKMVARIAGAVHAAGERWKDELAGLRRFHQAAAGLLNHEVGRMVGFEERLDNFFDHLLQHTTHPETMVSSLVDQFVSTARGQMEASLAETMDVRLDVLRKELMDELRKAIPGAAAQIIREEIQALSQEET